MKVINYRKFITERFYLMEDLPDGESFRLGEIFGVCVIYLRKEDLDDLIELLVEVKKVID